MIPDEFFSDENSSMLAIYDYMDNFQTSDFDMGGKSSFEGLGGDLTSLNSNFNLSSSPSFSNMNGLMEGMLQQQQQQQSSLDFDQEQQMQQRYASMQHASLLGGNMMQSSQFMGGHMSSMDFEKSFPKTSNPSDVNSLYNQNLNKSMLKLSSESQSMTSKALVNSMRLGVDKLKDAASSTLPQKNNLSYMSRDQKLNLKSSPEMNDDDFESELEERSLKRRRKVSPDEMREKNRIYAKNHRAEKKRRQEELLKRNEMLEKENRHLKRLLMQIGIHPSGGNSFNPAQTIKNVGNSLVKGVKGGFGLIMPTAATATNTTTTGGNNAGMKGHPDLVQTAPFMGQIPTHPNIGMGMQGFPQMTSLQLPVNGGQMAFPVTMSQDFQCEQFLVAPNDTEKD